MPRGFQLKRQRRTLSYIRVARSATFRKTERPAEIGLRREKEKNRREETQRDLSARAREGSASRKCSPAYLTSVTWTMARG